MSNINYDDPDIKKQINSEYQNLYTQVILSINKYIEYLEQPSEATPFNEDIYKEHLIMIDMMKQTIEKFNPSN